MDKLFKLLPTLILITVFGLSVDIYLADLIYHELLYFFLLIYVDIKITLMNKK